MNNNTNPIHSTKPVDRPLLWSASPTPFTPEFAIDTLSVRRLIDHHAALDVDGIMLGGGCGEGPWMPAEDWCQLLECAVAHTEGRLRLAVQVTDNSALRMLKHSERMARLGADAVVIAAPYFLMNATPENVFAIYKETIEQNPLPVFYYDRGQNDRYRVDQDHLGELLSLENLHMVKDSSCDPERAAIGNQIKQQRSGLKILTGDEFAVADAVANGMDGAFIGGAIFNAPQTHAIMATVKRGKLEEAQSLQQIMNDFMLTVYGGPSISAWLTGLKYFMQKLGVFSYTQSYLNYPLSAEVRADIDALFVEPQYSRFVEPLQVLSPAPTT